LILMISFSTEIDTKLVLNETKGKLR
jgi:hypothetical protein